ncbi:MAG: GIY-YIG nuclease family protein [Planctomycetaceae bacterium]|nr:GIY-YIG nuclease family protein [Planctomycetaceae bacterium]
MMLNALLGVVLGMCGGAFCAYFFLEARSRMLSSEREKLSDLKKDLDRSAGELLNQKEEFRIERDQFKIQQQKFDANKVSYQELQEENAVLKRDLRNVDVQVRKTQLDVRAREMAQQAIEEKVQEVGDAYLADNVKWIASSVNANNFGLMKQRLQKIISDCREMGLSVPSEKESTLLADLRSLYEKAVRAAFEREEQARIKAQIREEKLREREIDRELKQLEREREAIKVALEKALRDARDQHSEEVERLRAKLAEAEARSQRAISQAQLTKSGHVYVISNIGSFGDGVYKIGMTRRLEPMDRVKELGDASVPFPFDVHMMISADDAPALENSLHKRLYRKQVNKMNPRKEFFKTSVEEIAQIVKENHGEIDYVVDAEALQYRQSLELTDDDVDYIEHVYDELDEAEDEGLPTIE